MLLMRTKKQTLVALRELSSGAILIHGAFGVVTVRLGVAKLSSSYSRGPFRYLDPDGWRLIALLMVV